ncbi:MAG: ABC transporter ATP-binding protein [Rubrivivax sp.]|nr:MAG: ABC transporter ATP-binding protein [Rubrivivax sp.]
MFLTVDGVSVFFGGPGPAARAAVDEVSLGLKQGDIGVLLGPSGCGKTTLLRAIAGLEHPQSGRIALDGQQVVDGASRRYAPAERRRIGMVFQDFALFPHMTVAQNVGFGIAGLGRAERRQRVQELLDLVGLSAMAARWPHQLSGGQQQRVALARALAPRPRLLLLDEPFSSLDVDLRERLAHEVRAILRQTQTTALFVTHDQLEAFALGDFIGVMRQGRLHQWAAPYELYHRPATRFVAEFIGHGVFTAAQAGLDGAGQARLHTALGDWPLPDGQTPSWGEGPCDLLLRADDVLHDDASTVQAEILRKAFRGSEFLYTLRLDSGETVMAHVPSHHDHAIGERIGIRLELDHIVTFPRQPAAA